MDVKYFNEKIELLIDSAIYCEEVIYKCFYWYTNNFNVEIEKVHDGTYKIVLTAKIEKISIEEVLTKIKKDLIDFKLRQIVFLETKNIREIIIAKAFAYYDVEFEPLTEVSDPVGFDPTNIH